jgi:midasin
LFQSAQAKVEEKIENVEQQKLRPELRQRWRFFFRNLGRFAKQRAQVENGVVFDFVEGALVEALRCGGWVLLDELNLASSAVLECLNGLLENDDGSLILTERGDTQPLNRHPAFRIFGCMNPATDVGKREIPPAIRGRMTEFYIEEPHHCDDLKMLIREYLSAVFSPPDHVVSDIAEFYRKAHQQASEFLCGGDHRKPHYSLRTLCRALDTTRHMTPHCGFVRALYEGMCVSFLTQLDTKSYATMQRHIAKHFAKKLKPGQLNAAYPRPGNNYELVEHFWLKLGPERVLSHEECKYILTASVRENLRRLSRVLIARQYPILLQGPTSSGKTSMVEYIAKRTGHKFVRINNHEHTDLQEYMGSYITDPTGRLVFQEGLLVQALRHGHWIVLDELNLAPTDVLEALNRLLDDNRELFLPETQEVLKAHPDFQLFATQNPPGIYGGRKLLSRAFRNRFVELHFDAIPEEELATILEKRSPPPARLKTRIAPTLMDCASDAPFPRPTAPKSSALSRICRKFVRGPVCSLASTDLLH